MVLAPGPIVIGSIGLSRYVRPEQPAQLASNEVIPRDPERGEIELISFQEAAPPSDKLIAACAARRDVIRQQLGDQCAVITAAPFVVAGDMSEDELQAWYERTIQPAAIAMGHCYFDQQPTAPITVLLFRSQASYEHFADKLYRDRGISIYGYYKPRERTLVMNIATGGGTLVHELTHALIAFDCPQTPDWFNEGLASLHEQCRFREDERGPWIEGLVNWRLPRLQKELATGRLPSLADFLRDDNFRGEREAVNYAQARYFCLFLQRRGLLEPYYFAMRKHVDSDPHGEQAIREVFPDQDWAAIDAEFHAFIRSLKLED